MNAPPKQSKFQTYRARKKAAGLREFRRWVPDIDSPEFKRRLAESIERINASAEERHMLDVIDQVAAETWADLD